MLGWGRGSLGILWRSAPTVLGCPRRSNPPVYENYRGRRLVRACHFHRTPGVPLEEQEFGMVQFYEEYGKRSLGFDSTNPCRLRCQFLPVDDCRNFLSVDDEQTPDKRSSYNVRSFVGGLFVCLGSTPSCSWSSPGGVCPDDSPSCSWNSPGRVYPWDNPSCAWSSPGRVCPDDSPSCSWNSPRTGYPWDSPL